MEKELDDKVKKIIDMDIDLSTIPNELKRDIIINNGKYKAALQKGDKTMAAIYKDDLDSDIKLILTLIVTNLT